MTYKNTQHPFKKMPMCIFSVKLAIAALLSLSVLAQPTYAAEQEWWFDIEIILFERNLDATDISEKFKQSRLEQPTTDYLDPLSHYLRPDLSYLRAGLPYCRVSNQLAVKKQYEQDFAFPVSETNESFSSQPSRPTDQDKKTNQGLAFNSSEVPEENFVYEVATTDIFAQSDSTIAVTHTTVAGINSSDSEQNNITSLDPKANIELAAKITLAIPPIDVEFVEWQIPKEFLCAYAEQIDPSFESLIFLQNDTSGDQPENQIKRVPKIIDGIQWQHKRSAFLLPAASMQMSDLYNKIKKQRNITPILHVNWRQEVKFGRENGHVFRLFAGENFADKFDANGLLFVDDTDSLFDSLNQPTTELYIPKEELTQLTLEQQKSLLAGTGGTDLERVTEDLFTRIDAALADDTPINLNQLVAHAEQHTANADPAILKELWQLDGGISIYLRNVGRVPYLHIDSSLDFRQPIFDPKKAQELGLTTHLSELVTIEQDATMQGAIVVNKIQQPNSSKPNFLQSASFNQLRRVISKQVHYFDHPLFGMVVQINRYHWPEIPSDVGQSASQDNP